MYKFLKCIFQRFDLFPLNFTFNINDEGLKKTLTGGFFSFLLIFLLLLIFITNIMSLRSWNDPIVTQSVNYIADNPAENIDLNDMQFFHSIFNNSTIYPIKSSLTSNSSQTFISI